MPTHADNLAQMGEIVNPEISPILWAEFLTLAEFLTFRLNFSPLRLNFSPLGAQHAVIKSVFALNTIGTRF
jgi:hypothetical protein